MKYRFTKVNGAECVVFNASDGFDNWSQRKNEYSFTRNDVKVDWTGTCNVTAYVNVLDILGYRLYSSKYPEYTRFADKLAKHICESDACDAYYKKIAYGCWKEWSIGKKGAYTPVEVHDVLRFGVSDFLGYNVSTFEANAPITKIQEEIILNRRPVVTSGKFGNLHHVVSLVGFVYEKEQVLKYLDDDVAFKKEVIDAGIAPVAVILDDPWGRTYDYENSKVGNDVVIAWKKFILDIKPEGSTTVKYAHFFKSALATC